MTFLFYRFLYRPLMRLMHRFDLHYMPKSYPDGDTLIWCHWCGARDVIKRAQRNPNQLSAADLQKTAVMR